MIITSGDIEAARELLTEKWGRGSYHNTQNDTYCAVGALDKRASVRVIQRDVHELFCEARVISWVDSVERWNDNSSKQEVLDGFMKVAKFLRDKGE